MTDTQAYRDAMEAPMEELSMAMYGVGDNPNQFRSDSEIVEVAARKITMLKQMVVASGVGEALLDACMRG